MNTEFPLLIHSQPDSDLVEYTAARSDSRRDSERCRLRLSSRQRCSNCEQPLKGRYCYACGQRDVDYGRPFFRLIVDVLKEAFEVDGRIAKTIVPLLFRPGHLGQRVPRGSTCSLQQPSLGSTSLSRSSAYSRCTGGPKEKASESSVQSDLSLDEEGISINVGDSAENALSTASAKPDSDPNPDPDSDPDLSSPAVLRYSAVSKTPKAESDRPCARRSESSPTPSSTPFPRPSSPLFPTFAIFLKLLYWRRNFFDHIIFSLNHHIHPAASSSPSEHFGLRPAGPDCGPRHIRPLLLGPQARLRRTVESPSFFAPLQRCSFSSPPSSWAPSSLCSTPWPASRDCSRAFAGRAHRHFLTRSFP